MSKSTALGVLLCQWIISHNCGNTQYVHPNRRYACDTSTCSAYEDDDWRMIEDSENWNATTDCKKALDTSRQQFVQESAKWCILGDWDECKQRYCDMYQDALFQVRPNKDSWYFKGCGGLLDFNYSLCLTEYRDASAYCDCFCPAMKIAEIDTEEPCYAQVHDFLMYARRGVPDRYLWSVCNEWFCEILAIIGDPSSEMSWRFPDACQDLSLPFNSFQCNRLLDSRPYDPCPWTEQTGGKDELVCSDGSTCSILSGETWGCCQNAGKRLLCPANYPFMCATPNACAGSTDYCCEADELSCDDGFRSCSPLLEPGLDEWRGISWRPVQTKTDLARLYPTRHANSNASGITEKNDGHDDSSNAAVVVLVTVALIAGLCALAIAAGCPIWKLVYQLIGRICQRRHSEKTDARITTDKQHKMQLKRKGGKVLPLTTPQVSLPQVPSVASQQRPLQPDQSPTPPFFPRPPIGGLPESMAPKPPSEPSPQQVLRAQSATAVLEALQATDRDLCAESRRQQASQRTRAKDGNRNLSGSIHREANPEASRRAQASIHTLGIIGQVDRRRLERTVEEASERACAFDRFDTLRNAATDASAENVDPLILGWAEERCNDLVSRLQELPMERCILDADGRGLRLCAADTGSPIEVNTGTDSARPVCAEFAHSGKCRLGSRCSWRHCTPLPGDRIRDSVVFKR